MSNLLDALVQDAATLVESELPAPAAVRNVLGALVKHVEELETKVLGPVAAPVEAVEQAIATDVTEAASPPSAAAASSAAGPATPEAVPAGNALQAERDTAVEELLTRLKALL